MLATFDRLLGTLTLAALVYRDPLVRGWRILFLLPILMSVAMTLFGMFMAAIAVFIGGGAIMVAGPFAGFPGGPVAAILAGLGLMAGSTTLAALTAILTIWLINGVVWFARLHYRLLKPALNTPTQAAARES